MRAVAVRRRAGGSDGDAKQPEDLVKLGLTRLAQQVYPRIERTQKPLAGAGWADRLPSCGIPEDATLDVGPGVDLARSLAGNARGGWSRRLKPRTCT